MNTQDAETLIEGAIPQRGGLWADLGCGGGTFTRALARLLGSGARIYAVDRDPKAIAALKRHTAEMPQVIPVVADFTRPFDLPGLDGAMLDGVLLANALHFVRDPKTVVVALAAMLRPGGRAVFVEYDQRPASRWVPYPISAAKLEALVSSAGFSAPVTTATRSSEYGGRLYVAAADRVSGRGVDQTGHS
jgi:2-polyprenyl-3-methyl-5-hydroxy-6-metoxy-1,4-benzoquinol methylase